jgi:hypothetical protein
MAVAAVAAENHRRGSRKQKLDKNTQALLREARALEVNIEICATVAHPWSP